MRECAVTDARMLFVNLAIKDLKRSVDFFTKLGFTFKPQFTSDDTTCMIISDQSFVMLLEETKFAGFATKPIADAKQQTEVLMGLSCSSREEVDRMMSAALASGGATAGAMQDHGFMYSQSFEDPDGHVWELVWMDPAYVQ